ncbi:caspase family protein [Polaribacter sp. Hel_I_88]|uniref:caspase family protein n=1 Tax=Polaribacter sp. Hel_I_88 TaxID=1250006 RepID=UPI00047D21A4|nr:caspase family protein [Polaribacter sp. Hel_I_88]
MKNFYILLMFIFASSFAYSQETKTTKHALIIAIGEYPRSTGWGAISSANDVPLIKETLERQGFNPENITTLVDREATKKGILNAFKELQETKIKEGDVVVIHYSGHGQPIFDSSEDGTLDEADDKDEALVPVDAMASYTYNYKGENHIRDDELAKITTNLRNTLGKNGQLLLLLDSCHSGSSARGGKARGTKNVFAPEGWEPSKNAKVQGSDMFDEVKVDENAAPYVLISGASADELNYEHPEGYGALSYAFSEAMSDLGSDFSYRQLFDVIASKMNTFSPNQNPGIEGDQDIKLFKNEYVKQEEYFKIKNILASNAIKIQAGKLQGMFKGTTVFLMPVGETQLDSTKIIAKGKVVLAKFNESNILLNNDLKSKNEKDYVVFIDKKSFGEISLNIAFDKSVKNKEVKSEVTNFLKETKLGKVVDSLGSDLIITEKNNLLNVYATNGFSVIEENMNPENLKSLKETLSTYAHGSYMKKLNFNNKKYEFTFRALPVKLNILTEENEIGKPEDIMRNNVLTIVPGKDKLVFEVTNHSEQDLYFTIIEVNSKGEINSIFPSDRFKMNDQERLIEKGKTVLFSDKIMNYGPPFEKLVMKCIASPYPINIASTIKNRGEIEGKRGALNPLASFVNNSFLNSRGQGDVLVVSDKVDGYTSEIIYEIVKE